jgi:DNA-binding GntR family transcriptional regulator|tara:strand:+ start:270 stop:962 length:693 start_codon:yes stop_codon:yes gene_type:complete
MTDRVYLAMRDQIVGLELEPFSMISEKRISEEMGVSRTPVREALARLAAHNLVDIYPQRGTFVSPFRRPDLERSQFLREALEVALVQRVIELPDRAELVKRLRAEVELQETFASILDEQRFFQSDEDFHRLISNYAGLPGLWEEIQRSKVHMDRCRHLALASVEKDIKAITTQHIAIVDAVEAGDAVAAPAAMSIHLRRIFNTVDKVMELNPQYFEGKFPNQTATHGNAK